MKPVEWKLLGEYWKRKRELEYERKREREISAREIERAQER